MRGHLKAAAIWLLMFFPLSVPAQEANDGGIFQMVFLESAFRGVNRNDGMAALTVWAEYIMKNRNVSDKAVVRLYENVDEVVDALARNEADVVGLSASNYLLKRDQMAVEPLFLAVKGRSLGDTYQLLVHRDSGITNLHDLAGSEILVLVNGHLTLGPQWLDIIAFDEGVENLNAKYSFQEKVLSALLPVFMKQQKACLVVRSAFQSAAEMNPQLKRDLITIRESDEMANAVIGLRTSFTKYREAVYDELNGLHESPCGEQILVLMKYDRLAPFSEAQLESTRQLMRRVDERAAVKSGQAGLP